MAISNALVSNKLIIAIMESGNALGPPYNGTEWHQPMYDRIVERAGYFFTPSNARYT